MIPPSLAGQMFVVRGGGGKECLVTIDRFSVLQTTPDMNCGNGSGVLPWSDAVELKTKERRKLHRSRL